MKVTLFITTFLLSIGGSAQSDTLNQIDSEGKKQGCWIIYGKDDPQKGVPVEGKIYEGTYLDDRRDGKWIFYHKNGETPKTKGSFKNNRPHGSFEMYYPNGSLRRKGEYNRGSYMGKLTSYWESGNLMTEGYYNEKGNKDEKEIHYFENAQVELEMKFNNGLHVDTIIAYYPNGDIKYMAILDSRGREIEKFTGSQVIRDSLSREINCLSQKEQYDYNGNPKFEGEFRNGCLWNGKRYFYDKDGLLIKIEIWKEGIYHSDGKL